MASETLDVQGGDKLAGALKALNARLTKAQHVKVGFLEGATYPGEDSLSVAQVAFWNEFGTKTAPARPFFRSAIAQHSPQWGNDLLNALKASGMDGEAALGLLGTMIKDQVVTSIVETTTPELSPVTLMLRKMRDDDPSLEVTGRTVGEAAARVAEGEEGATGTRAKPLIDTGVLQRSVDYVVEEIDNGS